MILQATNFQSWPQFEIEVEGLTCLVGPSDLGKSAVFRALKAVTRNNLPAAWIRTGSSEVNVVLTDGVTVSLSRTAKSSPKYEVNGEEFSKLQGGVPPEVAALGYGAIVLGDNEYDPIFAGQFDDQFGLTWSPTKVNQILGAFASTERLELGKKEVNRRTASINAEAKVISGELAEVNKQVVIFKDHSDQSEELYQRLSDLEKSCKLMSDKLSVLNELKGLAAKIREMSFLDDMPRVEFDSAETLTVKIEQVSTTVQVVERMAEFRRHLARVPGSPDLTPCELKAKKIDLLEVLIDLKSRLVQKPKLEPIEFGTIGEMNLKIGLLERLCILREEIKDKSASIDHKVSELQDIRTELSELETQLKHEAHEEGIECPKCGFIIRSENE